MSMSSPQERLPNSQLCSAAAEHEVPSTPAADNEVPSTDEPTPFDAPDSTDEEPQVGSLRDLYTLCDVHSQDGTVFLRSTFSFVNNQDRVYFGRASVKRKHLGLEDLKKRLKRVPDENVYPEAPSQITTVSFPVEECVYVKRPKLTDYEVLQGAGLLRRLFLEEAQTLELLLRNPHPHLVRYYGCIVNRSRVTGIVLDRYSTTLEDAMEDSATGFDKALFFERLKSAVEHLHTLGLAHNDLNPANIMLDKHKHPIVIDFGSCKPFGEALISGGTVGWVEEGFTTSERRHDEFALEKLRTWLDSG